MSSTCRTENTLCPFFRSHTKKSISCEGFMDGMSISSSFDNDQQKRLHKSIYCDGRYTYCEIYRMVMAAKYDDEDG